VGHRAEHDPSSSNAGDLDRDWFVVAVAAISGPEPVFVPFYKALAHTPKTFFFKNSPKIACQVPKPPKPIKPKEIEFEV
jgi:hypothetical protein